MKPRQTSVTKITYKKTEVRKMLKNLKRGDLSTIANATGYHYTHVSRVLKGVSNNPDGKIVSYAMRNYAKR